MNWTYGIRINSRDLGKCDWLRRDGDIWRFASVEAATLTLRTLGFVNDTNVEVPHSAYVANCPPEAV